MAVALVRLGWHRAGDRGLSGSLTGSADRDPGRRVAWCDQAVHAGTSGGSYEPMGILAQQPGCTVGCVERACGRVGAALDRAVRLP